MHHTLDLVCNTQMDIYIQALHSIITYKYVMIIVVRSRYRGRICLCWPAQTETQSTSIGLSS